MTALLGVLLALLSISFHYVWGCRSSLLTNKRKSSQFPGGIWVVATKISTCMTSDQVDLRGWWIPAEGSTRTVIFLHGYAGSCDPDLKYVPFFHEKGFNVVDVRLQSARAQQRKLHHAGLSGKTGLPARRSNLRCKKAVKPSDCWVFRWGDGWRCYGAGVSASKGAYFRRRAGADYHCDPGATGQKGRPAGSWQHPWPL